MGFKELFNEDFSASSSAHARVNPNWWSILTILEDMYYLHY